MRRLCIATTLLALALLALPALAHSRIVVQQGMAGIRIGMTQAQVIAAKGQPDGRARPHSEILGRYTLYRYGNVYVSLFTSGTVFDVRTSGRTERTASGVGVGSTETFLRMNLRGETCKTEFGYRHCWFGAFRPGRIVTDFSISRRTGRVTRVQVGRVID
jgi:hypothetical protein